jgi:hypothetical protein
MAVLGRPTKLNTEIQNTIVAAIQRGCYVETAAEIAGIDKTTFYDWLKKGAHVNDRIQKGERVTKASSLDLLDFSNAIKRATAQSELRDVVVIDTAAQNGVWQAAAWRLERKHHQKWGRKVAITDQQGGNFFTGMAAAWAEALELDEDAIEHSQEPKQLERLNGNGSA